MHLLEAYTFKIESKKYLTIKLTQDDSDWDDLLK